MADRFRMFKRSGTISVSVWREKNLPGIILQLYITGIIIAENPEKYKKYFESIQYDSCYRLCADWDALAVPAADFLSGSPSFKSASSAAILTKQLSFSHVCWSAGTAEGCPIVPSA